jgi:hypothetical protein
MYDSNFILGFLEGLPLLGDNGCNGENGCNQCCPK